jgi:hypothetical protein
VPGKGEGDLRRHRQSGVRRDSPGSNAGRRSACKGWVQGGQQGERTRVQAARRGVRNAGGVPPEVHQAQMGGYSHDSSEGHRSASTAREVVELSLGHRHLPRPPKQT